MKDIKELFTKIYGVKNPNEEQLQIFMDALKRRLTVRELEYVSFTYNVDLLDKSNIFFTNQGKIFFTNIG